MRYLNKPVVLFFSILVGCSCSRNDTSYHQSPLVKKNLTLHKVRSFILADKSDSGYTIGKLRFHFVSNSNNSLLAFYDEIKRDFLIANPTGEIKNIFGEKGRGPKEFVKVGGFDFNSKNQLVVLDEAQLNLKFFKPNGSLMKLTKVKDTRFPFVGRSFHIFKNDIYAPTIDRRVLGDLKSKTWKSQLAGIYSFKGTLIGTIGRYDPTVNNIKNYNKFSIINVNHNNHTLLSTQQNYYRIQIYDLKSKKQLAWFGHKTAHYKSGNEYISKYLSIKQINDKSIGRSATTNIYATNKYILLNLEVLTKKFFQTNDFNAKKHYLAVYDSKTHACYGEIKLPYILGNVAGNKLYLIEDANPDHYTVGVYEIKEGR